MTRYHGRHRKPTTTGRTVAKVAVTGIVVGAPLTAFAAPASAAGNNWDAVAQCESGGNWSINTGNGFSGGLQFTPSTWSAYGGQGSAQNASREQQIQVAERVLASQGAGAWPVCGKNLGAASPTPVQAQTKSAPVQQSTTTQQSSAPVQKSTTSQKSTATQKPATQKPATTAQKPATTVKSAPATSSSSAAGSYTVQSGDTLSKIAAAQGVSGGYQAIFALNQDKIQDVNLIFPGEHLRLS